MSSPLFAPASKDAAVLESRSCACSSALAVSSEKTPSDSSGALPVIFLRADLRFATLASGERGGGDWVLAFVITTMSLWHTWYAVKENNEVPCLSPFLATCQ